MNILVDLTYVDERPTGVSIYAERLLRGMLSFREDVEFFLLGTQNNLTVLNRIFPDIPKLIFSPPLVGASYKNIFKKNKREQELNTICQKNQIDLFFVPFLTLWSCLPTNTKKIAVMHDLQPLSMNSGIKKIIYARMLFRNIQRCDSLVCISHYVGSELVKIFPNNKTKMIVIYNSVYDMEEKPFNHWSIDENYILSVNSMVGYKNQLTILKAFIGIADRVKCNLVFKAKGNDYWRKFFVPLIERHGLTNRVFLLEENLSSGELCYLYKRASLFVNASLMEGFGYTPIEAALQETPVLTSRVTSLGEVTMNLLNYIENPLDEKEIGMKILDMLSRPKNSDLLKQIRITYLKKYSVENQAQSFLQIFYEVLKNDSRN